MTAHFNYKLTLKSGEIYENTDGGSVGIIRDIFLEDYPGKPVTLTDYNDLLDKSIVLFNERELSLHIFGDSFPSKFTNIFKTDPNYEDTVFTFDPTFLSNKKFDEFLELLNYASHISIDNINEFLPVELEVLNEAHVLETFDSNTDNRYKTALRKRWFIEYLTSRTLFGFPITEIQSLEYSLD